VPNYECDGCGACCRTFPVFAAASDAEREPRIRDEGRRLSLWLATPQWQYQLYPLPFHETCCFLDGDNRCTIYGTRPKVCRRFEAGSDQCQDARKQSGLAALEAVARMDHYLPLPERPSVTLDHDDAGGISSSGSPSQRASRRR